jgi:hypothetical protein
MDDLKERLRAYEALIVDYADALEKSDDFADTVIGSDLREGSVVIDSALSHIEALEQRVSELEEALQEAVSYDDGPTYPWIVRAKQALAKARNEQVKQ